MKSKSKSKAKSVPPSARQLARERREREGRLAMAAARHAGYRYRSADVQPEVEGPPIFDNYQAFVLDATQMRRMQRYKRRAMREQMGR
ncbi:uncharacterized protein DMAD_10018 [Drosophila madeirensis]|uniref:Uncharacterized protein n=1 Tax=Drosophila madeirensis TaxID=30013 RepID=A0AAU9F867_DROMD